MPNLQTLNRTFLMVFSLAFNVFGVGCMGSGGSSSSTASITSSATTESSETRTSSLQTTSSSSSAQLSSIGMISSNSSASTGISSSAAPFEPPYSGTVYIDPDIFTESDPTAFESLTYEGRGERSVYDSRFEPKTTTKNCFIFTVTFDDGISSELQLAPDFNTEEEA